MGESTTIWLVRHGAADGSDGRCCGRYDVSLSAEGILQARQAARQLARESLSHMYSSPLSRAVGTARILAEPHQLTVETLEGLAEIHFGDLEGLTYDEVRTRYPEVFQSWMERPTETRFPNGENFQEMRYRVLNVLDVVLARHPHETIAIVAHAGVIRLLVAQALSIPDHQIFRLAQRHAAINRIDYFDHGAVVQLVNAYFPPIETL